jgi:hypothetical protein
LSCFISRSTGCAVASTTSRSWVASLQPLVIALEEGIEFVIGALRATESYTEQHRTDDIGHLSSTSLRLLATSWFPAF